MQWHECCLAVFSFHLIVTLWTGSAILIYYVLSVYYAMPREALLCGYLYDLKLILLRILQYHNLQFPECLRLLSIVLLFYFANTEILNLNWINTYEENISAQDHPENIDKSIGASNGIITITTYMDLK